MHKEKMPASASARAGALAECFTWPQVAVNRHESIISQPSGTPRPQQPAFRPELLLQPQSRRGREVIAAPARSTVRRTAIHHGHLHHVDKQVRHDRREVDHAERRQHARDWPHDPVGERVRCACPPRVAHADPRDQHRGRSARLEQLERPLQQQRRDPRSAALGGEGHDTTVVCSHCSSTMTSTPATTTAASAHHGAWLGIPPARTTRVSTGASSGSIARRKNRAMGEKGLMRRVRTAQSTVAITSTTPPDHQRARCAARESRESTTARKCRHAR